MEPDEYRREPKLKRESSPPPRGSGLPPDVLKARGHEGLVPTVKEGGRSIHLIPREDMRSGSGAKEGSITQVGNEQKLCWAPLCVFVRV